MCDDNLHRKDRSNNCQGMYSQSQNSFQHHRKPDLAQDDGRIYPPHSSQMNSSVQSFPPPSFTGGPYSYASQPQMAQSHPLMNDSKHPPDTSNYLYVAMLYTMSQAQSRVKEVQEAIDYLEKEEMEMMKTMPYAEEDGPQFVFQEDRKEITKFLFHILQQLRICIFSESDRPSRGRKRIATVVGFKGLQCVHCKDSKSPRKFFWTEVKHFGNSFDEISSHVLNCCSKETREALLMLKKSHKEELNYLQRGSQITFFRKMWKRYHKTTPPKSEQEKILSTKDSTEEANKILAAEVLSDLKNARVSFPKKCFWEKHEGGPDQMSVNDHTLKYHPPHQSDGSQPRKSFHNYREPVSVQDVERISVPNSSQLISCPQSYSPPSFPRGPYSHPNLQLQMNAPHLSTQNFAQPPIETSYSSVAMPYTMAQARSRIKEVQDAIQYLQEQEREMAKAVPYSEEDGPQFVFQDDRKEITKFLFHILKQIRICTFSESDRLSRGRKRIAAEVGFKGLQCVHCKDSKSPRKFFWTEVKHLANSFEEISNHVLNCRYCPSETKEALLMLKVTHKVELNNDFPRGSQKTFFRKMWKRCHKTSDNKEKRSKPNKLVHNLSPCKISTEYLTKAASDILDSSRVVKLAIDEEDENCLSEKDRFVRSSLQVFCASQKDVDNESKSNQAFSIKVGQIGLKCIHCDSRKYDDPNEDAIYFPQTVKKIYDSERDFQQNHLDSCPHLPPMLKMKWFGFKDTSTLSSIRRQYSEKAAIKLGMFDNGEGVFISCGELSSINSSTPISSL